MLGRARRIGDRSPRPGGPICAPLEAFKLISKDTRRPAPCPHVLVASVSGHRERDILEHAVRTIAEQAAKADELVDDALSTWVRSSRVTA
jgi:hypothetical protein